MYEKHKNMSLIINIINLSFFKDLLGVLFLTIVTKFTYEMTDNYFYKIIIFLSSTILLLILIYNKYRLLFEFILLKFFKIKKT